MKTSTHAAVCAAVLLMSQAACGKAPGFLCDPVVTHTNGMRLSSTTTTRNHNVYWQCEPGHVGYCDGHYHTPCLDDWRSLGTRCHGRYAAPYTPMGPTSNEGVHTPEGMECGSGGSVGMIQVAATRSPQVRPRASAAGGNSGPTLPGGAVPPASQDQWLDTLQTLGRKMMTGAEG